MDASTEELIEMVAHDLRSPLTAVISSIDILKLTIDLKGQPPEVEEYLKLGQSSSLHAASMVQSMLEIVRLSGGEKSLNRVKLDLLEILEFAVNEMRLHADVAKATIEMSGDHIHAEVEPDLIQKMLMNLLWNAIKTSAEEGVISCQLVDLGDSIAYSVRDEGGGMSGECLDRLNQQFSSAQGDSTHYASLGLGLTFCKLAVDAHHGQIRVESKEGAWTKITLKIPKTAEG